MGESGRAVTRILRGVGLLVFSPLIALVVGIVLWVLFIRSVVGAMRKEA